MRQYHLISLIILLGLLGACKPEAFISNPIEVKDLATEIEYIEHNLKTEGQDEGSYYLLDRMEHHKVPGVSITVVEAGQIKWSRAYGVSDSKTNAPIDTNTLFQAASISKPISALLALRLAEEGKVDLDENVNTYLEGWQVPDNEFTLTEKVSLRRLMSHSAGTSVHGFAGYKSSASIPTLEMVLAGEGNSSAVEVQETPGREWRYSGGGYSIMEKVIEDVSGKPLEEYFDELIAQSLEMTNSRFDQPLPDQFHDQASSGHNRRGKPISGNWRNHPEQAAAGLWTTSRDLAKYCIEIHEIYNGKQDGILSPASVQLMLTEESDQWGLGPHLGSGSQNNVVFQHGGVNTGFVNQFVGFADTGNAVVIMTNGDNGASLYLEILRGMEDFYDWNLVAE